MKPTSIHLAALCGILTSALQAQTSPPSTTLFTDVRIFDGKSEKLSAPSNVPVRGNIIEKISAQPIPTDKPGDTKIIDGTGKTLMPGLIDAHTHLMFCSIPQVAALTSDIGYINVAAVRTAEDMLLRGFTSVRDLGGPKYKS